MELSRRLSDTTGQHRGEVLRVLLEIQDAILFYHQDGRGVRIPGLGIFRPRIKGTGRIRVLFRADPELAGTLNNLKTFRGEIINAENIGLSMVDFKTLWDDEFPDDPLELPVREVREVA